MKRLIAVGLMLAVAACEAKPGAAPGGAPSGAEASAKKPSASSAVADANAAVPEALKARIKFVEGALEERKTKAPALVPEGWETGGIIPGTYKPKDGANLGLSTRFELGSNCDGACEAKDWAATSDKVEFAQFKEAQYSVVKDEKGPGFRLLVATSKGGPTHLRTAFWKEGARRYFTCAATLDPEAAPALPAFERACRAFTPVW